MVFKWCQKQISPNKSQEAHEKKKKTFNHVNIKLCIMYYAIYLETYRKTKL